MRASGSWGWRHPAFAGSGFHLVLNGHAWLVTADGPPRRLVALDRTVQWSEAAVKSPVA